jgi:hypothetical protein
MKHPNKKYEKIRKEYAWALMSRKRMAVKSCFDWWLIDNNSTPVGLNVTSLTDALKKI